MYNISCDGYILYDPRDDELIVDNPTINLEVNTVGEGSFTIYANHPYYGVLKKMKSVFEVSDDIGVIFRGRMTGNSYDFNNGKTVDLEGAMAYFNDSKVRPYAFPDDFLEDAEYVKAAESGNVIEFYLNWLIEQHNAQVQDFQRFKLGRVTVKDPNNYLSRSDSGYPSTWEVLGNKLFESSLGGYLTVRYEPDGNYIDYLAEFELTNTQEIVFGENLLDITTDSDATETYTAAIPIGATIEAAEEGGESSNLTIEGIADGNVNDDIVKVGDMIYSRTAVEEYGLIIAPVDKTTWSDVNDANNLLTKAVAFLSTDGIMLSETVEIAAVDLHFTDAQIQTFRMGRKVNVRSSVHGYNGTYQLSKIQLDLVNPQNTVITVGATQRTLTGINDRKEASTTLRIENAEKDIEKNRTQTIEVMSQVTVQSTEMVNTCNQIILNALESYVQKGNFNEFVSTLQSGLEVWAEGIIGRVTKSETRIEDVNGDLQARINSITKYFTFDINGLTIGQIDNPNKIVIDNDDITIYAKGLPVQEFKADGTALIPTLRVTKSLTAAGLQFTNDETHINCDYIGEVD